MYLLVTARKGISSLQLSKEIGITQKSAWFMLHRLREACGPDLTKLQGIVEIDETYSAASRRTSTPRRSCALGAARLASPPYWRWGRRERLQRSRCDAEPVGG